MQSRWHWVPNDGDATQASLPDCDLLADNPPRPVPDSELAADSFTNGTESDHHIVPGFGQMEAGLLDFFCKARHVGRAPGHDDVVRLREAGVDFLQEVPIAVSEEIINKLVL